MSRDVPCPAPEAEDFPSERAETNCDAQMLVSACKYLKCAAGEEKQKRAAIHFLPVPAIIIGSELSRFFKKNFFFSGTSATLWLLLLSEKQ